MTARLLAAGFTAAIFVSGPALAGDVEPGDTKAGAKLYRQMCSHCHGANMVNPGTVSFDLRKFTESDQERFHTSLMNGKGAMPPLGKRLKPQEIENLWAYILTDGKS